MWQVLVVTTRSGPQTWGQEQNWDHPNSRKKDTVNHRMTSTRRATPRDGAGAQRVRTLATGTQTHGRLTLLELREVAGQEPPCHIHEHEDEIVYVLAGELTFFVGDDACRAVAGDCLFLPRGTEHAYAVESGEARVLVVLTPAGLEGAFGELVAGPAGPEVERLITTAARYGVTITGPAPTHENRKPASESGARSVPKNASAVTGQPRGGGPSRPAQNSASKSAQRRK